MILLKIHGIEVTSELIRQAAQGYPFDSEAVLYLGQYHGYRDAPNPTTQDVIDQRDAIVSDLESEYPVTIETYTAEEQEQILKGRYTDPETGAVNWPDWYTPINS
jgi:hypothetical protein